MLIEDVKKQGKIKIDELSAKQIIALVSFWKIPEIKKQVRSFTEMIDRCYKSTPFHKNADIIYINTDEKTITSITHAFHDMFVEEEEMVMDAILKMI